MNVKTTPTAKQPFSRFPWNKVDQKNAMRPNARYIQ